MLFYELNETFSNNSNSNNKESKEHIPNHSISIHYFIIKTGNAMGNPCYTYLTSNPILSKLQLVNRLTYQV